MANENFTTWTEQDPGSHISATSSTITLSGYDGPDWDSDCSFYTDKGAGFYSGDFTFRYGPIRFTAASSNNSSAIVILVVPAIPNSTTKHSSTIEVFWQNTATNPTLYLREYASTNTTDETPTTQASYQNAAVGLNTDFYIEFSRASTTATCKVYSDAYTTLLNTLTFTLSQTLSYRYVMSPATRGIGAGATCAGTFQNLDLAASGGAATTRGTPFGHRGTAFNGGRTFHGILQ